MGARLCRQRRRAEPDKPPGEEPEVVGRVRPEFWPTTVFHEAALRRRRAKFGATWRACGAANEAAGQVAYNQRRPVPSWARFVQHKLLKNLHHSHSQTLKAIACNARAEK